MTKKKQALFTVEEVRALNPKQTLNKAIADGAALVLWTHSGSVSWAVKYGRQFGGKSFSKQFKFGEFPDLSPEMAEAEARLLLKTVKDMVDRQVERYKSSDEYKRAQSPLAKLPDDDVVALMYQLQLANGAIDALRSEVSELNRRLVTQAESIVALEHFRKTLEG